MAEERNNLPTPTKGRDLSVNQKIEIAVAVCDLYATDDYTLDECLRANQIRSHNTWSKWCREIAEIADLYQKAKSSKYDNYGDKLRERTLTALEKAITGYKVELEEEVGEVFINDGGDRDIRTVGIRKKEIYVRPSFRAIEFVMTNLLKNRYQRNPKFVDSDKDQMPNDISIRTIGEAPPPVISEDDIDEDIG